MATFCMLTVSRAQADDVALLWAAAGREGAPCGAPTSCAVQEGFGCVDAFCRPVGLLDQTCRPEGNPLGARCSTPWSCGPSETCVQAGGLDQPCRADLSCDYGLYCDEMGSGGYAYCRNLPRSELSPADRVNWSLADTSDTTNFLDASYLSIQLARRVYDSDLKLDDLGLSEVSWIDVTKQVDKSSVGSILRIAGSPSFGLIGGTDVSALTASAQAVVTTNYTNTVRVVAVRGTQEFGDALTDLNVARIEQEGVSYHQGFYIYTRLLFQDVLDALDSCQESYPVWLTGHSLGGASATIMALWLAEMGCNVQGVITFGAPATGDQSFYDAYQAAGLNDVTHRWVNRKDAIACLPLGPRWVRVGTQHTINWRAVLRDKIHLGDNDDLCDGIGSELGESAYGYFLKLHDALDVPGEFAEWFHDGLAEAGICYSDSLTKRIVLGVLSGGASEMTCQTVHELISARRAMDQIIRLQSLLQGNHDFASHLSKRYFESIDENVP
jgi:hypothetical protein